MAVVGWNSPANYLNVGSPILTATPLTMFGWIKPSTYSVTNTILCLGVEGTAFHRFWLHIASAQPGRVGVSAVDSATADIAYSSNLVDLNQWNAVGGVWENNSRRTAWCNGVKGTPNTAGRAPTPSSMNRTKVGLATSNVAAASGPLAEVTLWDVALSDEEMTALADRVHPLKIRPEAIRAYWPLIGPTHNLIQDNTTLVGSLSATNDHPPVSGPARLV